MRVSLGHALILIVAAAGTLVAQNSRVDLGIRPLYGITLGDTLPTALFSTGCRPASELAMLGGRYRITTDDMLFRSPHEHSDRTAVLEALEHFAVCSSRTAGPPVTLAVVVDSRVVQIIVRCASEGA